MTFQILSFLFFSFLHFLQLRLPAFSPQPCCEAFFSKFGHLQPAFQSLPTVLLWELLQLFEGRIGSGGLVRRT